MSDRLTLANAIEEAGIERAKAERVASAIVDLIRDTVATKADVTAVRTDLKADVAEVSAEMRRTSIVLNAAIASVRGEATLIEHRLLTRLGALMVVVAGALFAALRYLPPAGHG